MAKPSRNQVADLLRKLHKQASRPGQGPAVGPYWIVMNLSRHKNLSFQPPGFPFRHPTLASAIIESKRLAALPNHRGWRFGIFEFTGVTSKVEAATAPPEFIREDIEAVAA